MSDVVMESFGSRVAASSGRGPSPDGTMVMPFAGFCREIVAPERLVFTLSRRAVARRLQARTVLTVRLRAADGGTGKDSARLA